MARFLDSRCMPRQVVRRQPTSLVRQIPRDVGGQAATVKVVARGKDRFGTAARRIRPFDLYQSTEGRRQVLLYQQLAKPKRATLRHKNCRTARPLAQSR